MIFGAHTIIFSDDPDADRAFFRDVLGFTSVDAGHNWLIFSLPPAELAVHPGGEQHNHELSFMCDDLDGELAALGERGVSFSPVEEARWGRVTKMRLPGGSEVGLYEPNHPSPLVPGSH